MNFKDKLGRLKAKITNVFSKKDSKKVLLHKNIEIEKSNVTKGYRISTGWNHNSKYHPNDRKKFPKKTHPKMWFGTFAPCKKLVRN